MTSPKTPEDWANRLIAVMDCLALTALALTNEIKIELFLVVALLLIASKVFPFRLARTALVISLFTVIASGVLAYFVFRTHPIVAAGYSIPVFHALLWFRQGSTGFGWRLGMGFIELILAAAITSEAYLAIFIFIYAMVGALALSCSFLASQLKERYPELLNHPLPKNFISNTLALSFAILLSSAVIFQVLPRVKSGGFGDLSRVGYTEEVSISDWTKFSGSDGGSVAVWIYTDSEIDLSRMFLLGLMRGRVLEIFDGKSWSADPRKNSRSLSSTHLPDAVPTDEKLVRLEAVRGTIGTDVLPTPYGTQGAWSIHSLGLSPIQKVRSGEYAERYSRDRRIRYGFAFIPGEQASSNSARSGIADLPNASHTFVPTVMRTHRMDRLVEKIRAGSKQDSQIIQRLNAYFRSEGFSGILPGKDDPTFRRSGDSKLNALEHFIFVSKQGHCELFASAYATILRLAGIPSRLVAGFKISRKPMAGTLTVRSSDAHAWVEAYIQGRGWIPIDPSPRQFADPSLVEQLKVGYEILSGAWFRYVLGFSSDDDTEAAQHSAHIRKQRFKIFWRTYREFAVAHIPHLGVLILLGAGIGLYLSRHRIREWRESVTKREGHPKLRAQRKRLERALRRDPELQQRKKELLESWRSEYDQARFGAPLRDPGISAAELRQGLDRILSG